MSTQTSMTSESFTLISHPTRVPYAIEADSDNRRYRWQAGKPVRAGKRNTLRAHRTNGLTG